MKRLKNQIKIFICISIVPFYNLFVCVCLLSGATSFSFFIFYLFFHNWSCNRKIDFILRREYYFYLFLEAALSINVKLSCCFGSSSSSDFDWMTLILLVMFSLSGASRLSDIDRRWLVKFLLIVVDELWFNLLLLIDWNFCWSSSFRLIENIGEFSFPRWKTNWNLSRLFFVNVLFNVDRFFVVSTDGLSIFPLSLVFFEGMKLMYFELK